MLKPILLALVPALVAQAALADSPVVGPVAGPIEVFAMTDTAVVMPGQFTDFGFVVQNFSTDSTARVRLDIDLQYADGRHVQPFNINTDNPITLGPGDGVVSFVFIQVPPDAPIGPAVFTISARVGRVTGGTNHSDYVNPLYAVDSVPFLVDAPPSLTARERTISDAIQLGPN